MKKPLLIFIFFISIGGISAQDINVSDALSRMERAIDNAYNEEFTMRDSYYIGRTVAAHILGRYRLYTENPALTNYLNLICLALAINSPSPNWYNGYYVMVLDDSSVNAFSTPGGHIFISRGFIELTSSEDTLAAIIAHELAHIQLHHGTAEIMNSRLIQQLEQERQRISSNIVNETQQQMFAEMINEITQTIFTRGYSQLQEFEADSMAYNLLASAGYNPNSLMELLVILERLQGNQLASLNNTHPQPSQRITNLQRQTLTSRTTDNSAVRRERFNRVMGRR